MNKRVTVIGMNEVGLAAAADLTQRDFEVTLSILAKAMKVERDSPGRGSLFQWRMGFFFKSC